jgi:CHAD domain-containing protein
MSKAHCRSEPSHDHPENGLTLMQGDWTRVLGVRRRHCETMHDLRKAIREARYDPSLLQTPLAEQSVIFNRNPSLT